MTENNYSFQVMPQPFLINFLDKKDNQFIPKNGNSMMVQPIQMVNQGLQLQTQFPIQPQPFQIQSTTQVQLQPEPQIQQAQKSNFLNESIGAFTPESFVSLSPPQSVGNDIRNSRNINHSINNNYCTMSPNDVLNNLTTESTNTPSCPDLTESPFTSINGSVDNLSMLSTPSQIDSMRKLIYDEASNSQLQAKPETLDFENVNNNINNYQIFQMMPKQMLQLDVQQQPASRLDGTVSTASALQTPSNLVNISSNPIVISQANNNKLVEKSTENLQKTRLTIDTGKKKKHLHKRDLSLTSMMNSTTLMSPVQAAKYPPELKLDSASVSTKNLKESVKTPLFQTMVLDFSSNKKSIKVQKNSNISSNGSDGYKNHRKTKSESRFSAIKRRNTSDLSISTTNTPTDGSTKSLNTPVSTASIIQLCGNNFTPVNTHFQFNNVSTPTVEQPPKNALKDFEFDDELDDEELLNFDIEASFNNNSSPEEVLSKLFSQDNKQKKKEPVFNSEIMNLLPTLEEFDVEDKEAINVEKNDECTKNLVDKAVNSIFEDSSNATEALKNNSRPLSSAYTDGGFIMSQLNVNLPIPETQLPVTGTFKIPAKENATAVKVASRRGRKQSTEFDPSKIFGCTMCTRKFKRQEHLKRHFRSLHTGEKPFNCEICNKRFSRNDNLGQHMKIHNS